MPTTGWAEADYPLTIYIDIILQTGSFIWIKIILSS